MSMQQKQKNEGKKKRNDAMRGTWLLPRMLTVNAHILPH